MVRADPRPGPGHQETAEKMRAETQFLVEEIKQAIGLLRRHL
jgi:hypothetical protein